jgi:hypothetical protein
MHLCLCLWYVNKMCSICYSVKAIPVIGLGGPQGCETSRLPYFSRQSVHRWWCSYQPHQKAALYPKKNSWYSDPSSRTMALGSTQLLTEMSTRNLPGG